MTYADAAYQMGRCVLMTRALADGDLPLLHQVAHDRMQEPYRATLIPDYQAVRQLVTAANGVLLISGSGSTMLAIVEGAAAARQLQAAASQQWPAWRVQIVQPSTEGVRVSES